MFLNVVSCGFGLRKLQVAMSTMYRIYLFVTEACDFFFKSRFDFCMSH